MLTLGIDTSTEICALGLADEEGILGEVNLRLIHRHGEELHSNLDYLLSSTGKRIEDLEGLCIGYRARLFYRVEDRTDSGQNPGPGPGPAHSGSIFSGCPGL